jgi:hypothetical protein
MPMFIIIIVIKLQKLILNLLIFPTRVYFILLFNI